MVNMTTSEISADCKNLKLVEVCNDFPCEERCVDDYFDLVILVHQSKTGNEGLQNLRKFFYWLEQLLLSFESGDQMGLDAFQVSLIIFGKKSETIIPLSGGKNRTELINFLGQQVEARGLEWTDTYGDEYTSKHNVIGALDSLSELIETGRVTRHMFSCHIFAIPSNLIFVLR